MLVRKWMTPKPYTIQATDAVSEAMRVMKEKGIRHLPVLDGSNLVGIVSDRDIKEYTPSKATSLDVRELNYVLAKASVSDAMKKNPLRVAPGDSIERAAVLLHDNKIGCLPVLDDKGAVVGILTQEDVFGALIAVLGARPDTVRLQMTVADAPGSVRAVVDRVREYNVHVRSMLTSHAEVAPGTRELILHVTGDTLLLERELHEHYPDLSVHRGI